MEGRDPTWEEVLSKANECNPVKGTCRREHGTALVGGGMLRLAIRRWMNAPGAAHLKKKKK